jgi:hypothetical protein
VKSKGEDDGGELWGKYCNCTSVFGHPAVHLQGVFSTNKPVWSDIRIVINMLWRIKARDNGLEIQLVKEAANSRGVALTGI